MNKNSILIKLSESNYSRRAKHGALLDAEILAEVYLELIGARQAQLGLAESGTRSDGREQNLEKKTLGCSQFHRRYSQAFGPLNRRSITVAFPNTSATAVLKQRRLWWKHLIRSQPHAQRTSASVRSIAHSLLGCRRHQKRYPPPPLIFLMRPSTNLVF